MREKTKRGRNGATESRIGKIQDAQALEISELDRESCTLVIKHVTRQIATIRRNTTIGSVMDGEKEHAKGEKRTYRWEMAETPFFSLHWISDQVQAWLMVAGFQ